METYHRGVSTLKRGKCQQCRKTCNDLSLFRGKYICRDCLCPDDYDPEIMENLAMKASRRKWGEI
jgi:hypothetical protein